MAKRNIVNIDESKCDGCGKCVTACAEGAIRLVDGKARLVSESHCDGLGACLGECPRGAITVETRDAPDFVKPPHLACPGTLSRSFQRPPSPGVTADTASELTHWPVQLALVSPNASHWDGADLLVAADCVAFAHAGFHQNLLKGKKLIIACPKLDDREAQVAKLSELFAANDIKSVTVARMEVPCCAGLLWVVETALRQAGKPDMPFHQATISVRGEIIERK